MCLLTTCIFSCVCVRSWFKSLLIKKQLNISLLLSCRILYVTWMQLVCQLCVPQIFPTSLWLAYLFSWGCFWREVFSLYEVLFIFVCVASLWRLWVFPPVFLCLPGAFTCSLFLLLPLGSCCSLKGYPVVRPPLTDPSSPWRAEPHWPLTETADRVFWVRFYTLCCVALINWSFLFPVPHFLDYSRYQYILLF